MLLTYGVNHLDTTTFVQLEFPATTQTCFHTVL